MYLVGSALLAFAGKGTVSPPQTASASTEVFIQSTALPVAALLSAKSKCSLCVASWPPNLSWACFDPKVSGQSLLKPD